MNERVTEMLGARRWLGLALSGLMLATLPACSGTTPVASAGNVAPSSAKKVALLTTSAQSALRRGDGDAAVRDAEAAVMLSPDEASGRALLGRAYLAAGRFQSADTAFADALTLDPAQTRIAVTRALAQIALGDKAGALASLDQARGQASEADIGLALALAGERDQAIDRLEAAARAPGADARTRQNLALTYALASRWNDAAATAAIDVPAEQMGDRMKRWSQLGQRSDQPLVQVAMLLGILPAADAGVPQELALAKKVEANPVELALAEAAPAPKVEAPAVAEPVVEQIAVAEAAPVTPEPRAVAASVPTIKLAALDVPTPSLPMTALPLVEKPVADKPAPMMLAENRAKAPAPRMVAAPRMILASAQRTAPKMEARTAGGFVVQLGAFSSARRTEAAWAKVNGKGGFLTNYTPVGSGFRQAGSTLYRLSISGLETRAEATKLCGKIKARGGECFVRAVSGDKPMRWAMRPRDSEAA